MTSCYFALALLVSWYSKQICAYFESKLAFAASSLLFRQNNLRWHLSENLQLDVRCFPNSSIQSRHRRPATDVHTGCSSKTSTFTVWAQRPESTPNRASSDVQCGRPHLKTQTPSRIDNQIAVANPKHKHKHKPNPKTKTRSPVTLQSILSKFSNDPAISTDLPELTASLKNFAYNNQNIDNPIILAKLLPLLESRLREPDMENAEFSDLVWSIGKLGFKAYRAEHRASVCYRLLNYFCQKRNMTPRQVTTSLGGFARMAVKWNLLDHSNQEGILRHINSVSREFNSREISNVLHSMGTLGMTWSGLPVDLQMNVMEALIMNAKMLYAQEGCMSIYSLGLLGADLERVAPAVKDCVIMVSINVLQEILKLAEQSSNGILPPRSTQQVKCMF